MKKLAVASMLILALAAMAHAHGGAEHVMGTVKAMTGDSITVMTTADQEKTVMFDANTKFTKNGEPATAKDLKVGDRVVMEVHAMDGKLHAEEVRFGKAPAHTHPQ